MAAVFKGCIVAAIAAVLVAVSSPAAAAADSGAFKSYGFVNMARVMHESSAGQGLRKDIEAKGQQFQAELSREGKALSAERQKFESARAQLAKDEAEKQWRALETKYASADKMARERQKALETAAMRSSAQIRKTAVEIIVALSKERNYAAVFSQESVVLAAEEFDITDEVIRRLNQKLGKVSVDWSGKQPKTAGQQ